MSSEKLYSPLKVGGGKPYFYGTADASAQY